MTSLCVTFTGYFLVGFVSSLVVVCPLTLVLRVRKCLSAASEIAL